MTPVGVVQIADGQVSAPDDDSLAFATRLVDRAVTAGAWRVYACEADGCGCGCRRYMPA